MTFSYRDIDFSACAQAEKIAVALSGGADSLALAHMAWLWAQEHGKAIHLLTVDHGLRAESAQEAKEVGNAVKEWPGVTHQILRWDDEKPDSRIQEEARKARYDLLAEYCLRQGIEHLLVAHHQDDQAETFLFRLAKGSGLDGLTAMRGEQNYNDNLMLVRPLLCVPKQDLLLYCREHKLSFVSDPSNENPEYVRPRLRAIRDALEAEGLSAKRLSRTAQRLLRARTALEQMTENAFYQALVQEREDALTFNETSLRGWPDEIVLRVILKAMMQLRGDLYDYPPRLEKVEDLVQGWLAGDITKTQTLGGCLFVPEGKSALLSIKKEPS